MFTRSSRPVLAAVLFTVAGFVLIVLAWNGAASLDRVPGQLPYAISGGLGGLALVLVGGSLAIVHELRRSTARILAAVEDRPDAPVADPTATGLSVVAGGGPTVVAGRTTFHLDGCRVVAERGDLPRMRPQDAAARGLAPCRVCDAATLAG